MKKAQGNRDKENKSPQTAGRGSLEFCSGPWRTISPLWRDSQVPTRDKHTQTSLVRTWRSSVYFWVKPWAEAEGLHVTSAICPGLWDKTSYQLISDPWSHFSPEARRAENPNSWQFPKHILAYEVPGGLSWGRPGWGQRKRTSDLHSDFCYNWTLIWAPLRMQTLTESRECRAHDNDSPSPTTPHKRLL